MSGKSRVDYLVSSESQRLATYGGWCHKLNAVCSSLYGIVTLLVSFLVLSHDRLQIGNYLGPKRNDPKFFYYDLYPSVFLGCAACTTATSIIQIMASLMLLFEDITLNVWKWLKFIVLMVSSVTVMILINETHKYGEIAIFQAFFVVMIINAIYCMLHLTCNFTCFRSRKNVVAPY